MKSRFAHLKSEATQLRKKGASIKEIEKVLRIPRSTLSGWLKHIVLSPSQQTLLKRKWEQGLLKARKEAVKWHHAQKAERLEIARHSALGTLARVGKNYDAAWELALGFLYLGEGAKKSPQTSLGSSDPQILQFFVTSLNHLYGISMNEMKCELHLRADQNPHRMKRYWAQQLNIPLKNFGAATLDPRTEGRKTYPGYYGVCIVRAPGLAIQRKLVYISREFCEAVSRKKGG